MGVLIFNFKCKVSALGKFNRPDLYVTHCEANMSETELRIAYRQRKKEGYFMPPKTMNINALPDCVTLTHEGFLCSFRVEI